MRFGLVAFVPLALLISTGCGGVHGSLGVADDGSETGGSGPGTGTSGGEGTGESGATPPDVGGEGGTPACLPTNADGSGGPGFGRPVTAAFSPIPGRGYVLTDNDGFAQVVSSELSSAKLALLDGWDLWPGGIEVGPDGSVYVSATIQRDPQNGFESRQWAARLTADLVPIWRKQIHPYSADQDAWAERAVFVDDQLWLFGSVTVENDEWTMWTTVTIVDTEGELVDAIEIGFPPSAHKGGTQAHAVWTDGDEVVVGGAMQAFNDGQGWDDGWIASLSAAATINWVAAPAPAATDLTATADRLWVVEGATLHELDRQANPIAQHQLAGTAVGIAVLDEHLIVASSTQTDSTVECFDLQGELIGAEQVYPPDLTTLRARPHEVLLAGEGEDGEYVETILFD